MSAKANLSRTDSQNVRNNFPTFSAKKSLVVHFYPPKDCSFAVHHVCCVLWSDAKKHEQKIHLSRQGGRQMLAYTKDFLGMWFS